MWQCANQNVDFMLIQEYCSAHLDQVLDQFIFYCFPVVWPTEVALES